MNAAVLLLGQQRCVYHPQREASARCPECRRFFCRECITEHEDRVLCASCLARLSAPQKARRQRWVLLPRLLLGGVALAVVFLLMLLLGNLLLLIPSEFHSPGKW